MRIALCDNNRILCEALASMLQARGHPVLAIATTASDSMVNASFILRPDRDAAKTMESAPNEKIL